MARIAGVELPKNKRMDIALTYIYGIGRPSALKILAAAKVDPAIKTDDLSADQQVHIRRRMRAERNGWLEASCRIKRSICSRPRSRLLVLIAVTGESPAAKSGETETAVG